MTPATIIEQAAADGVTLMVTPAGMIRAAGSSKALLRWRSILTEHKPGIVSALRQAANDPSTHYRWSIQFPNLDPVEVIFAPDATLAEVMAIYPGAKIEPLPEPIRRPATPTEAAELRALVRAVLADAPQEWDEVTAVALADPEAALVSFRLLAAEARERAK